MVVEGMVWCDCYVFSKMDEYWKGWGVGMFLLVFRARKRAILFTLNLKLSIKITLDHPPTTHHLYYPHTTNFSKVLRLSRRILFDM